MENQLEKRKIENVYEYDGMLPGLPQGENRRSSELHGSSGVPRGVKMLAHSGMGLIRARGGLLGCLLPRRRV